MYNFDLLNPREVIESDFVAHKTIRGPTLGPPFVTPLKALMPRRGAGYPRENISSTVALSSASLWPEIGIPQTARYMIDSAWVNWKLAGRRIERPDQHIPFFTENQRISMFWRISRS
jgi:hypothetical protein